MGAIKVGDLTKDDIGRIVYLETDWDFHDIGDRSEEVEGVDPKEDACAVAWCWKSHKPLLVRLCGRFCGAYDHWVDEIHRGLAMTVLKGADSDLVAYDTLDEAITADLDGSKEYYETCLQGVELVRQTLGDK